MPRTKMLSDPAVLRRVTREVISRCLDVNLRTLHSLVERGILPEPEEHGVWDLPACLDAYLVYRAKLPVPRTWLEAEIGVDLALRAKRVYLRRAGAPASEVNEAMP